MKHKCHQFLLNSDVLSMFRKIWISGLDNRLVFRVSTRSIKIDCDKKVFFLPPCVLAWSESLTLVSSLWLRVCVCLFYVGVGEWGLFNVPVCKRERERESCLRMLKKEAGWVLLCVCVCARVCVTVNACACVRVCVWKRGVYEGSRRSSLNAA